MTQGHQLVSLAEAAATTGVSTRTLRRRIADGSLPAYRVGPRLIKVYPIDVERLVQRIPTVNGTPPPSHAG